MAHDLQTIHIQFLNPIKHCTCNAVITKSMENNRPNINAVTFATSHHWYGWVSNDIYLIPTIGFFNELKEIPPFGETAASSPTEWMGVVTGCSNGGRPMKIDGSNTYTLWYDKVQIQVCLSVCHKSVNTEKSCKCLACDILKWWLISFYDLSISSSTTMHRHGREQSQQAHKTKANISLISVNIISMGPNMKCKLQEKSLQRWR